ncbi:helix-turn-helix domain-containing protein [Streptomyces sp. NPDC002104]
MSSAPPSTPDDHLAEHMRAALREYDVRKAAEQAAAESLDHRLLRAASARLIWKAIEPTLPALMTEASADGWTPDRIADAFGVTPSYVYRKLREQPTD